jgi:hypothetical protein
MVACMHLMQSHGLFVVIKVSGSQARLLLRCPEHYKCVTTYIDGNIDFYSICA